MILSFSELRIDSQIWAMKKSQYLSLDCDLYRVSDRTQKVVHLVPTKQFGCFSFPERIYSQSASAGTWVFAESRSDFIPVYEEWCQEREDQLKVSYERELNYLNEKKSMALSFLSGGEK